MASTDMIILAASTNRLIILEIRGLLYRGARPVPHQFVGFFTVGRNVETSSIKTGRMPVASASGLAACNTLGIPSSRKPGRLA